MKRRTALAGMPCVLAGLSAPVRSQPLTGAPGVSAQDIIFGQTCDLSASRAAVANAYTAGARLHFDAVNRRGGIHGRQLKTVQLDDGYMTERALANAHQLTEMPVFAMLHSVGTAIAAELIPFLESRNVPYLHPLTGADELRAPKLSSRQTFFLRASYRQEVHRIVHHLQTLGISRIALVHEDEPFGHGIREQVEAAMREAGLSLSAVGLMPFNQPQEVEAATRLIHSVRPDVVIVGSAGPSVENFIASSHRMGLRSTYCCLSVSNVTRIFKALGPLSKGIVTTQVMPALRAGAMPVVRDYLAASAEPSSFGLEGFISARVITQALDAAGPQLTRAKFLSMLERPPGNQIGGFPIGYPPSTRTGSPFVELAMIGTDGRLLR
jgi:branched-chain amino acid transport system substrate-binding protein